MHTAGAHHVSNNHRLAAVKRKQHIGSEIIKEIWRAASYPGHLSSASDECPELSITHSCLLPTDRLHAGDAGEYRERLDGGILPRF